jgi:cysteinyl-tRNA synthetase
MAKSLKNFITIREALEKFSPKQIRIMFLLQQWDRPVNFSDQTLNEAREKESRINSFFARVDQVGRNLPIATSPQKWDEQDKLMSEAIIDAQE